LLQDFPMRDRDEIKRLLAAAGEPPTLEPGTARAVRTLLAHSRQHARVEKISWLPRGWEIACVMGSALALGVITAEWRLRRSEGGAGSPTNHYRYLASIDPTVAAIGKASP
jgi:hypothetical protein